MKKNANKHSEERIMDIHLRKKVRSDFYKWKETVTKFNRFDMGSPLLSVLEDNKDSYSCHLDKGLSFFRGRIFNLDEVASTEEELERFLRKNEPYFQGYNENQSGAPPHEFAVEGRLNCKGIAFLYTCNNPKTAIYELRPIKSENISIAEFITNRELKFADLRMTSSRRFRRDDILFDLLYRIAAEFSRPHYMGHNYWFTQYLAGQFINMGFDGIVFESSLHPEGDNLVFFYPEDCTAVNSRLYRVEKISISSKEISREDLLY